MLHTGPASSPDPGLSLRSELKKETSELHDRLDIHSVAQLKSQRSPQQAQEYYRTILELNYGIVSELEKVLHRGPQRDSLIQCGVEVDRMEKTHLIQQDLRELGLSDQEIDALPVIDPAILPRVDTPAEAAGVLYVLEGSSVGGPVIAAMIDKFAFGGQSTLKFSFLKAYGDFMDAREKFSNETIPALEGLVVDQHDRDQAVAAAKATFEAFIEWFEA